jgi:hypothetical protein
MSLEQSLEKLTAAVEALTGVLVASQGNAPAPAPAVTSDGPKRGRPTKEEAAAKAAAAAAAPPAKSAPPAVDDEGLGGDDDEGLGEDPEVNPAEAKAALLAFRDCAVEKLGKEKGIGEVRLILKKYAPSLDGIDAMNADQCAKLKAEADAMKVKLKK